MDIPINDLKAVFGDFEKLQKNQTKVLSDLYKILTGEKTLPSTNRSNSFFDKLNPEKVVDREEKDSQKGKKTEEPVKKETKTTAVISPVVKEGRTSNRIVATVIFGPKAVSILDNHFKSIGEKISSGYFANTTATKEIFKSLSGRLDIASRVLGKKIWDGMKDLGSKFKDYSTRIGSKIMAGLKGISFKSIGDKMSGITGSFGRGFDAIKGVFKSSKKEIVTKPKGETQTAYSRQSVDIILPPKTRVVLEDILEGANISFFDKVKPYLENISTAISKIKIDGKDKKKDGMSGFLKDVFPMVARLLGPVIGSLGMILAGGAAAIGSVAVLINGLFDNGPLKGLKKLLGRGGLALAKGLIEKGITRLNKAVTTLVRYTFGKKAVDGVLKPIQKGLSGALKTLGELPGKLFKSIGKGLKSIFGNLTGKVAGTIAKSAGTGLLSKLAGTAGKFLLKGLKRLPLIGTLIGFGFAISRIIKGDFIGGLLDVASALSSAVPVVGTALSIAIDVFSAYRDTKTGGSEKAGKAQMGWISSIGKWLWNAFKKIPVIGPMAQGIGALFSGKFKEAFAFFGEAASETPLGMLVSFLSTNKTVKKAAATTSGWISGIGKWLWNGFKKIPIIGPMAQGIGALFSGKFKEAFKFFGEAASETPLGMLGSFLYSNLPAPAKAKAGNALSSIGKFFSSIKDKMLKAILKYIPEKIFGISVRSRVAKLLGISDKEGADDEHKAGVEVKGEKLAAATPVKAAAATPVKAAAKSAVQHDIKTAPDGVDPKFWSKLTDKEKQAAYNALDKAQTEKEIDRVKTNIKIMAAAHSVFNAVKKKPDEKSVPSDTNIKTKAPEVPYSAKPIIAPGPGLEDVHGTLKEQNGLILKLLSFNKQTANNTGSLLGSMNNPSNNVNVTNVTNSPTTFMSNPVSNTSFRAAAFAR